MSAGKDLRFRWGHVNINVADLDRSIAFYEKLGFVQFLPGIPYLGVDTEPDAKAVTETACDALGIPRGTRARACIMQLGEDGGFPKIDLTEFSGAGDPSGPLANGDLGLVRLCLLCPDLAGTYETLRGDGVGFLSEPQPGEAGMVSVATCRDPDGNLIELLEIHPDKWPR